MLDPTEVTPEATTTQTPDATPAEATPATDETLLGKEPKESTETKTEAESEKKVVPEKYELKAPEGMTVDQGMLDKLTPVFQKHGLTQEAVQEIADAYSPTIKAMVESQVEATRKTALAEYNNITEGWKNETMKELGADADKQLAFAAKAINKFGGQKLREALNDSGFGNHPEMARLLINVGKSISEDSFAEPNKQSTGSTSFYDHPTSKATLK